jgi:hypothetical protein
MNAPRLWKLRRGISPALARARRCAFVKGRKRRLSHSAIIPTAQLIFCPDCVPNWQLMNKEALGNLFIDFSLDGGRANFAENLRYSSFNKDF